MTFVITENRLFYPKFIFHTRFFRFSPEKNKIYSGKTEFTRVTAGWNTCGEKFICCCWTGSFDFCWRRNNIHCSVMNAWMWNEAKKVKSIFPIKQIWEAGHVKGTLLGIFGWKFTRKYSGIIRIFYILPGFSSNYSKMKIVTRFFHVINYSVFTRVTSPECHV